MRKRLRLHAYVQAWRHSLVGTRLAHAEVNALAQLPSSARYESHTIYSALEPCLLCLGATLMSTCRSDPICGRWILDAYGRERRAAAARLLALGDPGEQLEEALPRLLPLL